MSDVGATVTITEGKAKGLEGKVVQALGLNRRGIRLFKVLPTGHNEPIEVWADEMHINL